MEPLAGALNRSAAASFRLSHTQIEERKANAKPPKVVYEELMEFGLAILFAIGAAWMYLTTPEQRQMI